LNYAFAALKADGSIKAWIEPSGLTAVKVYISRFIQLIKPLLPLKLMAQLHHGVA
jgi:hypothetical protein